MKSTKPSRDCATALACEPHRSARVRKPAPHLVHTRVAPLWAVPHLFASCLSRSQPSSRADSPVLEPPACSDPLHLFWNTLDQLTWSVGFLQQGLKRCNLDLGTSLLGKYIFLAVRTHRANLQVLPRDTEDQIFVPTGAHVARVWERARYWVEAKVGVRASWRVTRSDRGEP
ncbi:hypothetical protein E5676_scaffold108G00370 [Cucumis melo var. makuwa]|uniref:Uncharacterized protein n=1 Tax=Cucumis melo var. makuwa TaxID=1194695 RepID=A0A5D3C1J3_CUCMM|nr:hypothetical protein E5676_scaffold108G00370 [Cucumis melo var. makuwa]